MEFVNLTPHAITIRYGDGFSMMTIAPSGVIARVDTKEVFFGFLFPEYGNGITCVKRTLGAVAGLPEPVDGTVYIVSSMVLDAVPSDRTDVYAPDSGPTAERNENGHIVAVNRLIAKA